LRPYYGIIGKQNHFIAETIMKKQTCRLSFSSPAARKIAAAFFFLVIATAAGPAIAAELRLFAGAGLRQPVDQLVEQYQKKTGHTVLVDYDGGGRQLAKITASGQGDLFLPGSHDYIDKLEKQGLVLSRRPIVAHTPVIAVNKKSAAAIEGLADLCRPGVKVALGDPKAMALGKTAATILERAGLQEQIRPNVAVYGATVKQLALYAAEGAVDAGIIARADAVQFKDRVRMIDIPEKLYDTEIVAVAVLKTTVDEKAACGLRDFLSSPKAKVVFMQFGFLPLKK
jgi:molybdate transport system substrate-binding protein